MDTFDPNYDLEMKTLIFSECNRNKLIDGKMVYVLDDDYKYIII